MFERYVHVYALAWIGAVVLAYNAGFEMLSGTIVLGGIVAAYIGDYKQKQRQDQAWQEYRKKAFSEDGILEAQNQLESRIEQQRGCPDAFSGKAK